MTSPRTDSPPCCQLIDLLKETVKSLEERKILPIHARPQAIGKVGRNRILMSDQGMLARSGGQEIQDNRVIDRTVNCPYSEADSRGVKKLIQSCGI